MEGVPLPPGIPGLNPSGSKDPQEAVLGPFPCARLQNLPYDASLEDVVLLFQGLVVIDVLLVGQGEAFVIFANPMDFQMALQRSDRQTIGRRFISIKPASRADYYQAIAKLVNDQRGISSARGPAMGRQSEETAIDEGRPPPDMPSGLWRGNSSGSSSLQMASQQQHESMGHYGPPGMMPGRGVAPSGPGGPGRGGMQPHLQRRTGGGIQVGEHTGFLRMRGLPFSAARDDILGFFQGYNPIPESIVLTYRNDGRATGEAYIGFASPDDSLRAMDRHRQIMGSRYIELFISNRDEHGRAIARFGPR